MQEIFLTSAYLHNINTPLKEQIGDTCDIAKHHHRMEFGAF